MGNVNKQWRKSVLVVTRNARRACPLPKAQAHQISPYDKQVVKSERILRNPARPEPFVSTVFEGVFSRMAYLCLPPPDCQSGGPAYLYHVLGETQLLVSIFFLSPRKREWQSSRVAVVLLLVCMSERRNVVCTGQQYI